MLAAGKRDVALDSYAAAEKLLGSDPAKRVEVVARRGQALEGMGKDDDAVAEYRRAIKLAPKGYYLEVELTGRIIDIYRTQAGAARAARAVREGVARGRARPLRVGHARQALRGDRRRRTRRSPRSRRRSAKSPWELETQRRLIQLLENTGRDDEALAQYEAVVRAAPGEARFQLELAERYWRRGEEKKALDVAGAARGAVPAGRRRARRRSPTSTAVGQGRPRDRAVRAAREARARRSRPPASRSASSTGRRATRRAAWRPGSGSSTAARRAAFAKLGEVSPSTTSPARRSRTTTRRSSSTPKNPELYKGRAGGLREPEAVRRGAAPTGRRCSTLIGTKPQNRHRPPRRAPPLRRR